MSKNKKTRSRGGKSVLITAVLAGASALIIAPQPAQANPFKGVINGIVQQFKGTGLGIIKTAISNPVGTFRLLNQRVFKIDGTEKYLKYYDKYGQYLKYVPGIGGQTIPASLVLDVAAQQAGLKNGIPADLNAILDEILGPAKNANNSPNGSSGCFSAATSCKGKYTTLLEELQKNSVIASTGPLGVPDVSVLRAATTQAGLRGVNTDRLISNTTVAANFASNEGDRIVANAKIKSTLGQEGQQQSLDRLKAIDFGLKGINETASAGLELKVTQDVAKALLSVTAQTSGLHAIQAINSEQQKIDNALILNQLSNSSEAQDSIRRGRDTHLNAEAARLIHLTRRKIRF